jgi:hypothetical protein
VSDLASIRRLARLAAALSDGKVLPADDAVPIAAAIRSYRRGEVDSLDAALGLNVGAGERKPATRLALADRASLLRSAADRYFPNQSVASQARELHAALDRYAATGWLRERTFDECPVRYAGSIRADLWTILKIKPYVLTERALRATLAAPQVRLTKAAAD